MADSKRKLDAQELEDVQGGMFNTAIDGGGRPGSSGDNDDALFEDTTSKDEEREG